MARKTIVQQISAGGSFDGTAPAGQPTVNGDISTYAPEAAGGLFDPGHAQPISLREICVELDGNQDSYTVKIVRADQSEHVLASVATPSPMPEGLTSENFKFGQMGLKAQLEVGDTVTVETVGSTGALKASVVYED